MKNFAVKSTRVLIENEIRPALLNITDGKFSSIQDYDDSTQLTVLDVGDLAVLPGLVDTHVHINEPGRTEWEGFNTATQAAAAGGITTVVDMPLNCSPVTTTADALAQKLASLRGKLWVDCGFWGGVVPDNLDDLDDLIKAGVLGVKSFTIHSGIDEFPEVQPAHLSRAINTLANYDIPYLIHAELEPPEFEAVEIGDRYQSFLDSRPKSWENDAIEMMIALAQEAKEKGVAGKVHIVHLSSAQAIPAIRRAQQSGLQLSAETCPHYLTLFAENIPDGKTLFKCCPPIRENANREQLWNGLEDGTLDFIVSDHSPCTPSLKHIDTGDLEHAWGGISSLQFGLSIIWTEARQRGYKLSQVMDWMATRPAIFAGMSGTKGKICPGYDADFIIFDDEAEYTITADLIKYRHKITPYEGRKVRGSIASTYLRGQKIFEAGKILGTPVGQTILRKQPQSHGNNVVSELKYD
ncbi:MAG: allantoinase [Halieaceae bacterium]